jgi:hypothetical protein
MRELDQRRIHLRQRAAKRSKQVASMRLHFSKANAVNPGEQTDEVPPTVFIRDSGNIFACLRRHYAWKFLIDLARAKKLHHLILKFEKLERFFAVGNLQDELFGMRSIRGWQV